MRTKRGNMKKNPKGNQVIISVRLPRELLREVHQRSNGNRSEFIRLALAEYIKRN